MEYGLLGERLGHSFSPRIHKALWGADYGLIEKSPEELGPFLQSGGFRGLNVTIPYKQAVIPYLAELSEAARAIGSVNTILRREDGSLWGHNTDYDGFLALVKSLSFDLRGKKALVLGDGGAAKTVRAVLRNKGVGELVTISRRGPDNYENLSRHVDAALIVNTTPLGMYPNVDAAAVDLERFPACKAVLDLIYNPARTKLLLQAEELGMEALGGLPMLVEQGRKAAELFSGHSIPAEEGERLLRRLRAETMNVALIGMPGCGKSTVGRALAERLGRPFVDLDEELVKRAGKSIPTIFAEEGEAGFRARETALLDEFSRESGLVIATGGGVVTRPENRPLLRRNSRVIRLERLLEQLATDGRPLSQTRSVLALACEREHLYRAWAEGTVQVTEPKETARRIEALLWEESE